eukprot:COSAG02_NODE_3476_length_6675_cov_38.602342_2_plen_109_part_00
MVKEAKAAAKKAVEDSEPSGGGMSLMDELAPMDGGGGGDPGALNDELDKVRNRMEGLLSRADHQKEIKALKSALTKDMERTDAKIDEVTSCLQLACCEIAQCSGCSCA